MERCAATDPLLPGCSTTSPSMSAEDCTARQDSFMSRVLAVKRASEGLVVTEEIIDNE